LAEERSLRQTDSSGGEGGGKDGVWFTQKKRNRGNALADPGIGSEKSVGLHRERGNGVQSSGQTDTNRKSR